MKPKLTGYCLDWHINSSMAFYELLVDPLKPYADIKLVAWDGKNSDPPGGWKKRAQTIPAIFCQRPPPTELLETAGARLVWLPMWDNVALNWSSDQWWESLPKTLRVVAFSEAVARKARAAGLPTLRLRFSKDPENFDPVKWDQGRKLLYWNRTGLFGPVFIKKLCAVLDVRELFFRGEIDPKIPPKAAYRLPARIGRTIVHEISGFRSQSDYFGLLKRCNIYLAPRSLEGVGLTFLEALASGCAVLAYDAPTMNEYIVQGKDGYLFPRATLKEEVDSLGYRLKRIFQMRMAGKRDAHLKRPLFRVSDQQDWAGLEGINLELLGQTARQQQKDRFAAWTAQIAEYARFVMEW